MPNVELHTLYWPDNDMKMIDAHKSVMKHFELPVTYTVQKVHPGHWMNYILDNSKADVIGFLDSDCIPTNRDIIMYAANYALSHQSFIGIAQASNHIGTKSHIFAAPAFFFIYREVWNKMGKPSFMDTFHQGGRSDVAEEVSYCAEEYGLRYKALYPTHFEREPVEGVWHLGNYGYFGVGSHFEGGVYHLYQGRFGNNSELFVKRCNDVIEGKFSTEGMISSKDLNYRGRIVA
jgi:hypothetical protein